MKKFFCLFLALFMLFSVSSLADGDPLTENEQRYAGGWAMYASMRDGTVYHYSLTLLSDRTLYFRTLTIKDGVPSYNNLSTGTWGDLLSGSIYVVLSGSVYAANLLESDVLKLMDGTTYSPAGYFSRCTDMAFAIGE